MHTKNVIQKLRPKLNIRLKKSHPTSLQTDVYGRSAMPNYTLSFEMHVGQW